MGRALNCTHIIRLDQKFNPTTSGRESGREEKEVIARGRVIQILYTHILWPAPSTIVYFGCFSVQLPYKFV